MDVARSVQDELNSGLDAMTLNYEIDARTSHTSSAILICNVRK